MVNGDEIGYSMIQITELGKGVMFVAKILISIAIKQLIGLAEPGIIQGIESAAGLADKAMQMLPDIMQTESLSGIKDLQMNMKTLTDGLRTIEESLFQLKADELAEFDIKNEEDWVRIFAPIKPILKRFLESKSPEKMGVQVARDQYGKSAWLCKVHAKEMFDMKPISNSINSLNMSADEYHFNFCYNHNNYNYYGHRNVRSFQRIGQHLGWKWCGWVSKWAKHVCKFQLSCRRRGGLPWQYLCC